MVAQEGRHVFSGNQLVSSWDQPGREGTGGTDGNPTRDAGFFTDYTPRQPLHSASCAGDSRVALRGQAYQGPGFS